MFLSQKKKKVRVCFHKKEYDMIIIWFRKITYKLKLLILY